MNLLELLKTRRSIRSYREEQIPQKTLIEIIDTARYAPTGANLQPWEFILVTDAGLRQELSKYAKFYFIKSGHVALAPALIIILGRPSRSEFYTIDCSLAGANIIIAAHFLGLGTCWIGAFNEQKIKESLCIPDELKIVGMITIGFIDEQPDPSPKLSLSEILHFDTYRNIIPSFARLTRQGPLSIWKKILKVVVGKSLL